MTLGQHPDGELSSSSVVPVDERGRRRVVSYARRGGRLSEKQRLAWETYHHDWVIPDRVVADPGFTWSAWFDRDAPLAVEIGSGIGEATVALAAARPDFNVVAFEVWKPGLAETVARLAAHDIQHVRLVAVDAAWSLRHLFSESTVSELWTFFPDPWPKKRHAKRRLISRGFTAIAARKLRPGGSWRLATDWPDYADQIGLFLSEEPLLAGGVTDRWAERPITKFERKAMAVDRPAVDFCFRRNSWVPPEDSPRG
jgi:tRNA (guanine-N7-)-methyltransferase